MKKAIVISWMLLGTLFVSAQSWNPYVNQGVVSPSSLLPKEFKGAGVVSFNIGNTGMSPLVFDHKYPNNSMTLVITLSGGIPSKKNPIAALGGTWFSYFDWSYDASINTYTATQKRTIPGDSQGTITIEYEVAKNSSFSVASNGFNINIQPPPYANGANTTQDDAVSAYTFTRAYDYGDAPASYGTARHEIDVNRDPETNTYNRYIYLGTSVDPEPAAQSSANAKGDDANETSDENGVTFPALKAGTTVNIPVVVTVRDLGFGILNAWFDWNGDGDFLDVGERVTTTPVSVFASGTYNIPVAIPATAITTAPTFARFRIGANGGPTAANAWGEAEDYQVTVLKPDLMLTTTQVNVQNYGEKTGSIDLTVLGGTAPYTYKWSNGARTQDIANLAAGTYSVTVKDASNQTASASVIITQPTPASIAKSETSGLLLDGNREGLNVKLNWQTLTEHNTEWFLVERSTDGGDFIQIGEKVQAAGNSNTKRQYEYEDVLVLNEIAVYRIRLLETDGNERLSNTVTQRFDDRATVKMTVYPNPATDNFNVAIDGEGNYHLELLDALGRVAFMSSMKVDQGIRGVKQLSRGNLNTGEYYLRATEKGSGKSQTLKLMIVTQQ